MKEGTDAKKVSKLKVINIYGGPGIGKSTTSCDVFVKMKRAGHNVELVTEYAKDKLWDKHDAIFQNQLYIFAKQYQRLKRLEGVVDYAVTDSPLLMQMVYFNENFHSKDVNFYFSKLAASLYDEFDNYNIILDRQHPYQKIGRYQSEEEAKKLDGAIESIVKKHYKVRGSEHSHAYDKVSTGETVGNDILTKIEERWKLVK